MSGALTIAEFARLMSVCGPLVAPETMASVVRRESAFHQFAVGVNGAPHLSRTLPNRVAAEAYVGRLMASGHRSLDLGLAQINTAAGHMQRRGLPVTAAFDHRIGLRVGCEVLEECHRTAPSRDEQQRINESLACYNSGRHNAADPYVNAVRQSAQYVVPAIRLSAQIEPPSAPRDGSEVRPATRRRTIVAVVSTPNAPGDVAGAQE